MQWRTWRQEQARRMQEAEHHHGHDESRVIDTGHGSVRLEIFEDGVPPQFRLHPPSRGHRWAADAVSVETQRPDGSRQVFSFEPQGDHLKSRQDIPEPHEFTARLKLGHGDHTHD